MNKNLKLSKVAVELVGQPMFGILSRVQQMEKAGDKIIHLELGDPDFDAPKNVIEVVYKAMKDGITHYSPSMGLPVFREAIKNHIECEFGLLCDYEQVVATPGANSGIYWVIRCLLNEGDEVLLPNPGFPSFFAAAKAASAKIKTYKLDEANNFIPDVEEIQSLITNKTKLVILNSPSNPIGSIIPKSILSKIYDLAVEKNIYILSDDTYRRMGFEIDYVPSITEFDACKQHTIMLGGLSKEYSMSGFRLGYLVGPPKVIEKIGLYIETVNSCIPPFIQLGGIEALAGNQDERIKNLEELKKRRDAMVNGLNEIENISCHMTQGGLYVFPNISKTGLDCDTFFKLILNDAKIACVPGRMFGEAGKNHVRMSLNVNLNTIKKSIGKISEILKNN